jgi:hypothetical protein
MPTFDLRPTPSPDLLSASIPTNGNRHNAREKRCWPTSSPRLLETSHASCCSSTHPTASRTPFDAHRNPPQGPRSLDTSHRRAQASMASRDSRDPLDLHPHQTLGLSPSCRLAGALCDIQRPSMKQATSRTSLRTGLPATATSPRLAAQRTTERPATSPSSTPGFKALATLRGSDPRSTTAQTAPQPLRMQPHLQPPDPHK